MTTAAILTFLGNLISWFFNRSKEPSSMAGYALLAQVIQQYIPDAWTWAPSALDTFTAVMSALAVGLREKAQAKITVTSPQAAPGSQNQPL
jgi:hypothetical protein